MTARSKIERLTLGSERDLKIQRKLGTAPPPARPSTVESSDKTHLYEKREQTYVPPIRHPPVKTELTGAIKRVGKNRFDVEATPDPFVGSPEVFSAPGPVYEKIKPGLSNLLLVEYLSTKDAVMVFFYDPNDQMSQLLKPNVKEAARTTQRLNHSYMAVNCASSPKLCKSQGIGTVPYFKLYSRGKPIGSYNDETSARDLKKFVEKAPVIKPPPKIECKPAEKAQASGYSESQSNTLTLQGGSAMRA
ncbi:hypothetical protein BsWGS_28333 [Bradybaena similaris]